MNLNGFDLEDKWLTPDTPQNWIRSHVNGHLSPELYQYCPNEQQGTCESTGRKHGSIFGTFPNKRKAKSWCAMVIQHVPVWRSLSFRWWLSDMPKCHQDIKTGPQWNAKRLQKTPEWHVNGEWDGMYAWRIGSHFVLCKKNGRNAINKIRFSYRKYYYKLMTIYSIDLPLGGAGDPFNRNLWPDIYHHKNL